MVPANILKIIIFFLGASLCVCEPRRATCVIQAGSSRTITGLVSFYQRCETDDVQITVKISGLDPLRADKSNLNHGFHIHQWGDYTGGCTTMGGHYNPLGMRHGAPTDIERHVGDFGNLQQTSDGKIERVFSDPMATLFGPYSIIGRAVVLHEKADDLGKGGDAGSIANGNAGRRLGCCVIGLAPLKNGSKTVGDIDSGEQSSP